MPHSVLHEHRHRHELTDIIEPIGNQIESNQEVHIVDVFIPIDEWIVQINIKNTVYTKL